MINIRHGVFETNSSSSHSIVVNDSNSENVLDTIWQDEYGVITLTGGQFGWGYDHYNDALTKANYVAIDTYNDPEKQNMLIEVIKEHTGCKEVIIDISLDWSSNNTSYIDHQSQGLSYDYLYSKNELKDFIFDSNYVLIIDNDNR